MTRLILYTIVITFSSCKSEYTKAVEAGLSSREVFDSLIFGMKIGQTKKDFYSICWDLNKQQLISEGPGNNYAKYTEPYDSTGEVIYRKEMLFYGIFDENDIMVGMDMIYNYLSWSPWLEHLQSGILVEDLKEHFTRNYPGNAFMKINIKDTHLAAYAKIDGSRQILIYPKDAKDVAVKIEDLRHKFREQLKKGQRQKT
ncbi:MAG TPA: hypothetical protein PKC30_01550 [Saprospiraceae bacterium]|nr:hypothetical protein [Saprospiraceae bacterium]